MAYTAINPALIEIGEPTKKEIFQQIRDNQESFNTDIEALKQTATIDIFDVKVAGSFSSAPSLVPFYPVFKAPVGATITSFVATLLEASSSGTLQLDIEKSIDNGVNWSPLLTSPVEITGTSIGSVSGSVNWVDIPSQSFNQNDLLRIKFTNLQTLQGAFHISVYGELS